MTTKVTPNDLEKLSQKSHSILSRAASGIGVDAKERKTLHSEIAKVGEITEDVFDLDSELPPPPPK